MNHSDILLVGHVTKDTFSTVSGIQQRAGGAVFYGSFPAVLLGANVQVLTKCAPGDLFLIEELKQSQARVVVKPSQDTTQIENIAVSQDLEKRKFIVSTIADPFSSHDLEGLTAKITLVAPIMRGEFPPELLSTLAKKTHLALDVQGFIRILENNGLRSDEWKEKADFLPYITTLKTDLREAEILTGTTDFAKAAKTLAAMGPKEILITHQAGIFLWANHQAYQASFTSGQRDGRTGRGDTSIASYLALRFKFEPALALKKTAEVVSWKLEKPGPFRGPLPEGFLNG